VRAHELPVRFSDDRRFFVPVLVLFLVFILASVGPRGGMVLLPWKMMRLQMSSGDAAAPGWDDLAAGTGLDSEQFRSAQRTCRPVCGGLNARQTGPQRLVSAYPGRAKKAGGPAMFNVRRR
jgi:hypothetical protein